MLLLYENFTPQLMFLYIDPASVQVTNPSYEYECSKSDLRSEHGGDFSSKCSESFSVILTF